MVKTQRGNANTHYKKLQKIYDKKYTLRRI